MPSKSDEGNSTVELSEAIVVAVDIIAVVAIVDLRKTSDLIHVA